MINLDELRKELQSTREWHPLLLAVNSALVSMGTFQYPLEAELVNMTYGQWQHERAKRLAVAVLVWLVGQNAERGYIGTVRWKGWKVDLVQSDEDD